MHLPRPVVPPVPGWSGYPLGFLAACAVTLATVAVADSPGWTLGALAGTAGALATVTTLRAALATAVICWGLHTGFVVGRQGELAITEGTVTAAGVLGGAVVVCFCAGVAHRRHRLDT